MTGTIAFTRGDHVWVMRADGSGQRRLARGDGPAWSPDGRRIAFEVGVNEYPSLIYVVDVDGSGLRRLTRREQAYDRHSSPVWSPDGKTIAFEGYNDGNHWINVVGADGSGQRELSQRGGPYLDVAPVWSQDGRSIMFTKLSDDAVYAMRRDGSGRRVVGRVDGEDGRGVVWSPDRRRITVLIGADLWMLTAEGRRLVRLFQSPMDKRENWGGIAWAPDGRTIAFSVVEGKGEDAESEIYVVNADGDGLRKLTDNARGDDVGPIWSRDGRAIAFMSNRDGNSEIYVMNADGSDQRNLSRSLKDEFVFDWSLRMMP